MYIGNDLQIANPSYKVIDDISSSFNGSATSFALQVKGATPVPFPINEQQVMISVNGVIQEPDATGSAGFKLLGSNIVFSSAPANGNAFFGVILAGADYVTAGSEFPDGTVTAPSFTFESDLDSGFFRSGSGAVGYSANGVQKALFDGNGLTVTGTCTATSFSGNGSGLTNITATSAAASGLTGTTLASGVTASSLTSVGTLTSLGISGNLTVDTNTLFVEASTNRVGMGTTSPGFDLTLERAGIASMRIGNTSNNVFVDVRATTSEGLVRTASNHPLVFAVNQNEKARIDTSGRLLLGTTTEGQDEADDLTIATSGITGITIRSGTSSNGNIFFSDGTSGDDEYRGIISYSHSSNSFNLSSNAVTALTLDSSQNATFAGRIIGAKVGTSTLSTPLFQLYGSQSGATYGDLRVHNWGDSSGDYWRINSNLGLDSNGNTDKVDDSKKGAAITIDGRAGRITLHTSHNGTSVTHDVLIADSSGNATFAGTVSDSKGNLRSIPKVVISSAHTLAASDAGKTLMMQTGGVTVANNVMSAGDAVTIINASGSDQTITQGSGVTIYNTADASTGNRILAGRGMCTLWFTDATQAYISGAGLS
tara:strand:+ start:16717 stop:18504 length:1788 start_codon:yes stop_codon:yes gene_type:complete